MTRWSEPSKGGTLLLLLLAALIWVMVLVRYRDYVGMDRMSRQTDAANSSLPSWISDMRQSSDFKGNYRDPFVSAENHVEVTGVQPRPSAERPEVAWPPLSLSGIVGQTAIVSATDLDGPLFLGRGDSLFGVVIDRVFPDSIVVSLRAERRTLRLNDD